MLKIIKGRRALAAIIAAAGVPGISTAHDFKAGSLELKHPWSAKAPPVAPVLGGYLTIVNTGAEADPLVGGSTPAAERLELHESTLVDGVARMRPAKQGIGIPTGETVSLQPGGAHIMLVNPKQRPAEGEKFKATLQFEKAGPVEVEFVVEAKATQSAASEDHSAHSKP
ncbi:copper chaperone PCu(A)C [Rhizobium leguminosarum]|uniref:copper chaperone PCu(A)C n=1 Tax=Rhizobium leguminosarum TaxID=384 RepID=UPI001C989D54|nr:copper chaperone PCu(A)C [Rhizobium leguminosarum]MBY5706835.1 copper chaperone PCu(A)C [Rhizobium leguminosarum]MBY5711858.1 copper chaperone PCu(A)C [Rhizobium leguminosarum]